MEVTSSRRVEKVLGALGRDDDECRPAKHVDHDTLQWTFLNGGCGCCSRQQVMAAATAATSARAPRTVHQLRAEQGHHSYTYSVENPLSATIQSGDIIEVQARFHPRPTTPHPRD